MSPSFPDPPPVSFFTQRVLEGPWPLAIFLLLVALIITWVTISRRERRGLFVAGACAALAVAAVATGTLVETSGEHGERTARQIVEAATATPMGNVAALLMDNATLSIGSPKAPGVPRSVIDRRLDHLGRRYVISGNSITRLSGYTIDDSTADVFVACMTGIAAEGFSAPVPSKWVLRVVLDEDGKWRVRQITAISIARMAPQPSLW